MKIRRTHLLAVLGMLTAVSAFPAHTQAQDGLDSLVRPFTPQVVTDVANRHRNRSGRPLDILIEALRADLDSTGKFDFIVASYSAGIYMGDLIVFHETRGQLQIAFDAGPSPDFSGPVDISLVDVTGQGKPYVQYISHGANTHFSLDVFQWTGTALHSLVPNGSDTEDAELIDIDGDGILEIVTPGGSVDNGNPADPNPVTTPYKVYKFNGSQFVLAFTSPTDPTGRISADGQANQSVYGRTRIQPDHFSAAQIPKSAEKHESKEGEVLVRLGNLFAPVSATPGPVSAENFDLKSLVLGSAIHPLKVEIVQGDDANGGDDSDSHGNSSNQQQGDKGTHPTKLQGPFVQAHFSRESLLQFLPHAQLTKPLAAGDVLTLDVRGRMNNGAPFFSSATVKIVGEDEDKHHDKD